MAGDDRLDASQEAPDPDVAEKRLIGRLRFLSGVIFLLLAIIIVLVDTIGKIIYGPDFHTSEALAGMMVGALLVTVGVQGINFLPGVRK